VDFLEEAFEALLVDALSGLEHFKVNPNRSGEVNEGLNVLRKQKPPKPRPAFKN